MEQTLATSPQGRMLSLTPQHLAKIARVVPKVDRPSRLTPLSDADFAALADRLLDDLGPVPFWVFAYGSLIWKPEFEHVEARRTVAHGWRRSFCLKLTGWRATPETPGLMLALQRGGACTGVAYRMPPDKPQERMLRLLRREITYHEDIPWLRWLTVRGTGAPIRALAFYCTSADPDVLSLELDEQAAWIARAVGHVGSCAEYLHNTVTHLEALGIRDSYLWALQAKVAAEIDRL
jgi:cation transport protein ChaC